MTAALVRDEDRVFAYRGGESAKTTIDIYSCAGKLIRRTNVRRSILPTSD